MNTLTIKNLSKTYRNGIKAINNISMEINNGMFGLLGPNGAGKSSLMRTIVGLQQADEGEIYFNGTDIRKDSDFIKKQLGFLPQDFGVYPKVSAYDLLNHLAILKGVNDAVMRKKQIIDLLEKVNLIAHKNKEVYTFSGGMKQRFGVAQALLGNPQIIIVDEPTAGLDPEERNRFNNLLSEIGEDIIVILSTHLVEDVRNLCSKMAIIKNGSLLAYGSPSDMIKQLDHKVWIRKIERNELNDYLQNYQIISNHLIEKQLHITVLASQQPEGFSLIEPNLEHLYFHTLNQ
ncbi:ABC transporter ATP-binding protein [Pedobacter montanisoli]|uniref:ABC transporter ATP-binding protein n=1 Tax=Pedobacter montanisoli TaxID=2923277 RepID=A0ABS9ZRQ3_9SPHI|nr:ABC transporter ATP-binding protein [Pedobacter montanisoli]MCJ0741270.1 ABC transporter ATP-binding protein [Pedobacter montanisoli]